VYGCIDIRVRGKQALRFRIIPETCATSAAQERASEKKAGIDPAIIYAYETGRLVTEDNQHLLPETALDEWQAAIEEYEARHRNEE
jgi:hypothetical protein